MLDVVGNHAAYIGMDFYKVTPFNESVHYHPYCIINNWNDQHEVEVCRLAGLPDLDQDNAFVRKTLLEWINGVVKKFNFDGIRVDTVPEVRKDFWKEYAAAAGVYQVGEVFNGDIGYVSSYTHDGLDGVMNYPLYFTLKNVFNYKQSMYGIRSTFMNEQGAFSDMDALGVFIDNHDNPRFLSYPGATTTLFKAALTFTVFSQGIPIIYYGSEQGFNGGNDPYNREPLWTSLKTDNPLYKYISILVKVRKENQVWNFPHVERWCDDKFYAFTRGNVLIALTNNDSQGQEHRDITYHPYKPGQKLCNQLFSGDCVYVTSDNKVPVFLNNGEAKVYVPASSSENEIITITE
jgi:alpha-amylase